MILIGLRFGLLFMMSRRGWQDCFVLDAGTAGLFVWIGRNSTKNEKVQAMNKAQVFLKEHKRPWWSKVRLPLQDTRYAV